MDALLARAARLPALAFAPGDAVVREGDHAGSLWILASGTLAVHKGGVQVNTVTRPGALVGEVSLLLGTAYGATVVATTPAVLRHAADGHAFLHADPAVLHAVAVGLAERLHLVTAYLADLKRQYGDAPGLAMVSAVLAELAHRQAAPMRPGSARDPDPDAAAG